MLGRKVFRCTLPRPGSLGLVVLFLAALLTQSAFAAEPAEPRAMLASRYSGSDLSSGQSAWPPRGVPKTDAIQPLPYADGDIAPIPAKPADITPAAPHQELQSAQNSRSDQRRLASIFSEVRVGVLAHDVGIFENSREDGIDLNLEVYFASPRLLDIIWSPRPHIGIAVNTAGDTSQIYGGLAWDWTFWEPFFVEGTLALAVHDGKLNNQFSDRKALGCRVLFRESASLGARFLERHSISLQFAHISNANLCGHNAGLDTFGIQYGYRF